MAFGGGGVYIPLSSHSPHPPPHPMNELHTHANTAFTLLAYGLIALFIALHAWWLP